MTANNGNRGKKEATSSSLTSKESKETTDEKTASDVIIPPPLAPPKTKPVASTLLPVTTIIPTEEATPLPRAFQIQSADGQIYELKYPIFRNEHNVIFAVNAIKKSKMFSMKVELSKSKEEEIERGGSLKIELAVMSKIAKIRKRISPWGLHFLDMIDCGSCRNFRFIVSSLCGPNLKVLRSSILKRNFTMSAALLINYNTFNAVYDLHKIGYVHSVIRPTHFVMGAGDKHHIIYVIDFTHCSNPFAPITQKKQEKKSHTMKFMSRNVMDGKHCSFNDDLEAWLYMSIDIVNDSLLLWNSKTPIDEMRKKKYQIFYRALDAEVESSIPDEYNVIIEVLNSTINHGIPKYDRILSLLCDGLRHRNLNQNESWLNFVDKKKIAHSPLYSTQSDKLMPVPADFLSDLFTIKEKGTRMKMSKYKYGSDEADGRHPKIFSKTPSAEDNEDMNKNKNKRK